HEPILVEIGAASVLEPGHDDLAGGGGYVGDRLGDAARPTGRDVSVDQRAVRPVDLNEPAVALALTLDDPRPDHVAVRHEIDRDGVRAGVRVRQPGVAPEPSAAGGQLRDEPCHPDRPPTVSDDVDRTVRGGSDLPEADPSVDVPTDVDR